MKYKFEHIKELNGIMTKAGFGVMHSADTKDIVVFPEIAVSELLDNIENNIQREMLEDMAKYNDRLYKESAWMLVKAFLDIYAEHLRIKDEEKRTKNNVGN